MYGLRVYPGIHLFIGRCYDFFFPPVMNRISLEAYPLLPFISPSLSPSLPPFPPSVYLPLPPSKSQIEILYFFFLSSTPTELLLQSVSINDVEAFERYPVFSKSSTLCNFDSVLHLPLLEQQGCVYLGQSLCVLLTFLCKKGFIF